MKVIRKAVDIKLEEKEINTLKECLETVYSIIEDFGTLNKKELDTHHDGYLDCLKIQNSIVNFLDYMCVDIDTI